MPLGNIKARIPVAVTGDGKWHTWSSSTSSDECNILESEISPVENGDDYHIVWVEVDLPLPTDTTVKGRLTNAPRI